MDWGLLRNATLKVKNWEGKMIEMLKIKSFDIYIIFI